MAVVVVAGGLVLWILGLMIKQVIEKEYDSWAPALARALVGLGCRLHARFADEWRSELAAAQAQGESGLDYASVAVLGAIWLAVCSLPITPRRIQLRVRRRRGRRLYFATLADHYRVEHDPGSSVVRLASRYGSHTHTLPAVTDAGGRVRSGDASG
jgi:hypothetical protein